MKLHANYRHPDLIRPSSLMLLMGGLVTKQRQVSGLALSAGHAIVERLHVSGGDGGWLGRILYVSPGCSHKDQSELTKGARLIRL